MRRGFSFHIYKVGDDGSGRVIFSSEKLYGNSVGASMEAEDKLEELRKEPKYAGTLLKYSVYETAR